MLPHPILEIVNTIQTKRKNNCFLFECQNSLSKQKGWGMIVIKLV